VSVVLMLALLLAAVSLWPASGSGRSRVVPWRQRGVSDAGPRGLGRAATSGRPGRHGPLLEASAGDGGPVRARGGPHGNRRVRRAALEGALAELVSAVAAPLRAGVPPSVALAAAEPTWRDDPALGPLLRDLVRAARDGGSPAEVWLRHANARDSADLRFVGQAWAISERTGAPLADALASSEEVLRARMRARQRLAAAAAGPRASMAVLCLLPASGPVVGLTMGVDPRSLYFSSPLATASLALGVALAGGAWWWSRRILRRAT
jgi:tight adherence protein B